MKVLNLSWNDLFGEIPEFIGTLTELHTLKLQENQLSGNIPDNFCNLVNILFLNLSDNNLCPPYPECIEDYVGEQDTSDCYGCMDDGFQEWSPNPGSPACNYNPDVLFHEAQANHILQPMAEAMQIAGNESAAKILWNQELIFSNENIQ